MTPSEANNPGICPKCNSPLTPGMKFCESCGARIEKLPEVSAAPAEAKKPQLTPEPAAVPRQNLPDKKMPVAPGAAPGSHTKTLVIAGVIGIVILAAIVWIVILPLLSSPGTGTGGNGPALPGIAGTPVTTTGPAAIPGAATTSFEPKPTQIMPVNLEVTYQADRDPITGLVTVTFTGGPGLNGISDTAITVTRSDGQVVTKSFKPKQVGDSVTLQGTLKTDRIEVVTNFYNGESFRVIDKLFEYKKKN
jgi:hypothetical protein